MSSLCDSHRRNALVLSKSNITIRSPQSLCTLERQDQRSNLVIAKHLTASHSASFCTPFQCSKTFCIVLSTRLCSGSTLNTVWNIAKLSRFHFFHLHHRLHLRPPFQVLCRWQDILLRGLSIKQ